MAQELEDKRVPLREAPSPFIKNPLHLHRAKGGFAQAYDNVSTGLLIPLACNHLFLRLVLLKEVTAEQKSSLRKYSV